MRFLVVEAEGAAGADAGLTGNGETGLGAEGLGVVGCLKNENNVCCFPPGVFDPVMTK